MSTTRILPTLFTKSQIKEMKSHAAPRFPSLRLVQRTQFGEHSVVIKRLRTNKHPKNEGEKIKSDFEKKMFETELATFKLVNNQVSGIVDFYGSSVYETQNHICHYIVTAFMPKGDLYHFIEKESRLDWGIRLSIMRGMTDALSYLHKKGYVHDDLKSLNVLLGDAYEVKLSDFGTTEKVGRIGSGSGCTYQWRAPELFEDNQDKSLAGDIYSLGVTFWELASWKHVGQLYALLTHRSEKSGNSKKIQNREKYEPIPATCLPKIATLIRQCWMARPDERPNVGQVATQLRSVKP